MFEIRIHFFRHGLHGFHGFSVPYVSVVVPTDSMTRIFIALTFPCNPCQKYITTHPLREGASSSCQVLAAFFVVGAGVAAQHIGYGLAWRNFLEREFAVNVLYLLAWKVAHVCTLD